MSEINKIPIQESFNATLRDIMTLCEVGGSVALKNAIKQRLFVFADAIGLKKGDSNETK